MNCDYCLRAQQLQIPGMHRQVVLQRTDWEGELSIRQPALNYFKPACRLQALPSAQLSIDWSTADREAHPESMPAPELALLRWGHWDSAKGNSAHQDAPSNLPCRDTGDVFRQPGMAMQWDSEDHRCGGCDSLCSSVGIARANGVCNGLGVCHGALSQCTSCIIYKRLSGFGDSLCAGCAYDVVHAEIGFKRTVVRHHQAPRNAQISTGDAVTYVDEMRQDLYHAFCNILIASSSLRIVSSREHRRAHQHAATHWR